MRRKGLEGFKVFYNDVRPYLKAPDKVDYIKNKMLTNFAFSEITPNAHAQWLNQSTNDFEELTALVDPSTKRSKDASNGESVFGLYSCGVATQRDEWVYDLDAQALEAKVRYFSETYETLRQKFVGTEFMDSELDTSIKWDRELHKYLRRNIPVRFENDRIVRSLYRPFSAKHLYFLRELNGMQYQMPQIFPLADQRGNIGICFTGIGTNKAFAALATDMIVERQLLGNMQCLPLYRYTPDGERVSNITEWGLRRINDHYRQEWGAGFDERYPDGIGAEDIFAYTYAVLHDPVYRHDYRVDLLREFPRLPFYHDFDHWARMGQELLDLHLGFETADPYPLERVDVDSRVRGNDGGRAILRADRERGVITLDAHTTLTGVPADAFRYQLGSRSALEWVLDQYKERKPRDPTIRERFNTYRFADHKERVIDLLRRVCTVSVKTMAVVDSMAHQEPSESGLSRFTDYPDWNG